LWNNKNVVFIVFFWVVALCSLVEVYRRFAGACNLGHQGNSPDREARGTSQTSAAFHLTTWLNRPEDSHLRTGRCENLKSRNSTNRLDHVLTTCIAAIKLSLNLIFVAESNVLRLQLLSSTVATPLMVTTDKIQLQLKIQFSKNSIQIFTLLFHAVFQLLDTRPGTFNLNDADTKGHNFLQLLLLLKL
jgi:hypothetical protein